MTFNHLMASMLVCSLLLVMAGLIRNLSEPVPVKTRWGWFVVALPLYLIPMTVAVYRYWFNA